MSAAENGFHNNAGSQARVDLVVPKPTRKARRKEPDNDHYRSRLPPELPADCVCGYRDGRLWGTAVAAPRGSGEVLSGPSRARNKGACGDGSQWTCTLV